jgi:hypothetical protein
MILRFNHLMQGQYVDQTPLTATNMMKVVTSSVTASLSNTLSSSSRTDGIARSKDFVIDLALPNWGGLQVTTEPAAAVAVVTTVAVAVVSAVSAVAPAVAAVAVLSVVTVAAVAVALTYCCWLPSL